MPSPPKIFPKQVQEHSGDGGKGLGSTGSVQDKKTSLGGHQAGVPCAPWQGQNGW